MNSATRPLRTRSVLPAFAPGFIFDHQRARTDKLVLVFPTSSVVRGSIVAIRAGMEAIADGGVFQVASTGYRNSACRLEVMAGAGWLFGGSVTFRPPSDGRWKAMIELQLNPIRFFAHRAEAYDAASNHSGPRDILQVNRRARLQALRETLDNSDNYLTAARTRAAASVNWGDFTTYHIRQVTALVEEQLNLASEEGCTIHASWTDWTIRHAESTWEFDQPDARQTTNTIIEAMHRRSSNLTQNSHADSSSLTIPLVKNVTVGVYAKTDTRLRIELRHTKNIRGVYLGLFRQGRLAPAKYCSCSSHQHRERRV